MERTSDPCGSSADAASAHSLREITDPHDNEESDPAEGEEQQQENRCEVQQHACEAQSGHGEKDRGGWNESSGDDEGRSGDKASGCEEARSEEGVRSGCEEIVACSLIKPILPRLSSASVRLLPAS